METVYIVSSSIVMGEDNTLETYGVYRNRENAEQRLRDVIGIICESLIVEFEERFYSQDDTFEEFSEYNSFHDFLLDFYNNNRVSDIEWHYYDDTVFGASYTIRILASNIED